MAEANHNPNEDFEQRYQKLIERVPEEYRDAPDKYFEHTASIEKQAGELQAYRDWYEKNYEPWFRENAQRFEEYQRWAKEHPGGDARHDEPPAKPSSPTPEIDWDDPDAAKHAFAQLNSQFDSVRNEYQQEIRSMSNALESEREKLLQLLAIQEQARQIQDEDLYQHLGYKPTKNIPEIIRHARTHNLTDLRLAAQDLYRDDYRKETEQQAYERAKRELEEQYKNQHVTTETTSGTPPLLPRRSHEAEISRGYGNAGREDLLQRMQRRRQERAMTR